MVTTWDCGYANTAALCATLSGGPCPWLAARGLGRVVGAREIQQLVESAWREGFDPEGARFHNGQLVGKQGKRGWLGAAECIILLWHLRVEAFIIEIVERSRAGAALYAIAKACLTAAEATTSHDVDGRSSAKRPRAAIDGGGGDASSSTTETPTRCTFRAPLMLQWAGHSVSIVGVLPPPHQRLVVRDPRDRAGRLRLYSPAHFDGGQYQVVVCGRPCTNGAAVAMHRLGDAQATHRTGDPDPAAVLDRGKWEYAHWCQLRFV